MYKFTRKEDSVDQRDIKEILKFLNDCGWWNFVAFPTFAEAEDAKDLTERAIKILKNS